MKQIRTAFRVRNAVRLLLSVILSAALLLMSVQALAVTVLITNTADSVINTEYDADRCSVTVSELESKEPGVRNFELDVKLKDGFHKDNFMLTTTSGVLEKAENGKYLLTVDGGEQPVVKVLGVDKNPYATVRVFANDSETSVFSRDSECSVEFSFNSLKTGEYRSAVLKADRAFPIGTEITMKTDGKWYVYRVTDVTDTVSLSSFSALDGNGFYSLPLDESHNILHFQFRIDFSKCDFYPDIGSANISLCVSRDEDINAAASDEQSAEESEDTGESEDTEESEVTEVESVSEDEDNDDTDEGTQETENSEDEPVSEDAEEDTEGEPVSEDTQETENSEGEPVSEDTQETENSEGKPVSENTEDKITEIIPESAETTVLSETVSETDAGANETENSESGTQAGLSGNGGDIATEESTVLPGGLQSTSPETEIAESIDGSAKITLARETEYFISAEPAGDSAVLLRLTKALSEGADTTHNRSAEALVFIPAEELSTDAVLIVGDYAFPLVDGCFIVPITDGAREEYQVCFKDGSVLPGTYHFEVKRMLSRTSIPEACLNGVETAETEFELKVPEIVIASESDLASDSGSGSASGSVFLED